MVVIFSSSVILFLIMSSGMRVLQIDMWWIFGLAMSLRQFDRGGGWMLVEVGMWCWFGVIVRLFFGFDMSFVHNLTI